MGKQKQFDEIEVLDNAMRVFWKHGYASTSVQDLVNATGINRASMYDTFGDKRGLFLAALSHYNTHGNSARFEVLQDDTLTVRQALRSFFEFLVEFSTEGNASMGCLMTNSAIELAPFDDQVRAFVHGRFGKAEAFFCDALERGQARGELSAEADPAALAKTFFTIMQGIRVQARAGASREDLDQVVQTALSLLD